MDFKTVITLLARQFEAAGVRYGLMGGFALGLWGVPRATVDVDFLVERQDLEKADAIVKGLGYEVAFSSENVTQYCSALKAYGAVDFLHAFRETSRDMLARAVVKELYGGTLRIRVLVPEDIIGLKLQAVTNDPGRRETDLGDIAALAAIHGTTLDWKRVEQYAGLLDAAALLDEARRRA